MNNTVTMSCLGRQGRWGNQLMQSLFLHSYARRYRCQVQTNAWEGQRVFRLDDPPITVELPRYSERRVPTEYEDTQGHCLPPDSGEAIGHDLVGYFQIHSSWHYRDKEWLRWKFQPVVSEVDAIRDALDSYTVNGERTLVGLHLRRGDTGRRTGPYYISAVEWYLDWLSEHWARFRDPVLFIATEDDDDLAAFGEFSPVIADFLVDREAEAYPQYNYLLADLKDPTPANMQFLPDWLALSMCDILLIGESTFSFTAAMLGNCRELWRSKLSTQKFHSIDPWDAYPLVREDLRDFPGIEGTYYTENPKWEGGEVPPEKRADVANWMDGNMRGTDGSLC